MEESPHKCPVCSRSFNQRSNLKTHLLTHTDHKPYECNSCGKVFRRNCDLRRHALTHAVGDVLPEVLAAEGFPPGSSHQDMPPEMSPRPRSPDRRPEHYPPRSTSPVDRTKCHHGESSSNYTMRPSPQEDVPPPHHPQLQIRRDLHQLKPSTITSSSVEEIPSPGFKRRIQEPPDLNSSGSPRSIPGSSQIVKDSIDNPGPSQVIGTVTDLTVKRDLAPDRIQPPPPPNPPPKKHGFSIEDIMRRD